MNNQSSKTKQDISAEMTTKEMACHVAQLAGDKKAEDIEVIDVSKISTDIADFVVICSAETVPQLKAISAHIEDSLAKTGMEPAHKEGHYGDPWFLLDYTDFIVHIISTEAREFYNLEELWSKADFIPSMEFLQSQSNFS